MKKVIVLLFLILLNPCYGDLFFYIDGELATNAFTDVDYEDEFTIGIYSDDTLMYNATIQTILPYDDFYDEDFGWVIDNLTVDTDVTLDVATFDKVTDWNYIRNGWRGEYYSAMNGAPSLVEFPTVGEGFTFDLTCGYGEGVIRLYDSTFEFVDELRFTERFIPEPATLLLLGAGVVFLGRRYTKG